MSFLGKSYKGETYEHFDDYMKALGVGTALRMLGNKKKATTKLTEKNGVYTLTVTSPISTQFSVFKLGEEVNDITLDGRKVKSTYTLKDNVLTQEEVGDMKTAIITRTFTDTEMRTTLKVDDVICNNISKIVN